MPRPSQREDGSEGSRGLRQAVHPVHVGRHPTLSVRMPYALCPAGFASRTVSQLALRNRQDTASDTSSSATIAGPAANPPSWRLVDGDTASYATAGNCPAHKMHDARLPSGGAMGGRLDKKISIATM